MGREIRVTIDDDEVFERMKARKQELDLSWEEVLHRGLRREQPEGDDRARRHEQQARRHAQIAQEHQKRRDRRSRGPGDPSAVDPLSDPGQFADTLKEQIRGQVLESLQASLDPNHASGGGDDPLESEMNSLEDSEDAVLVFDFLAEAAAESANQVPLRVTLEASTDGLAVDVVAVRQGKTVGEMNAFDPAVRRQVIERLAAGETATLRIEAGAEQYSVAPLVSWSRTDGTPTVTEVSIEEVRFDVE